MSSEARAEVPFSAIKATLKRVVGALRTAHVPFMLGGGLAVWARGGPNTDHDLDLMVRPEDAERALAVLEGEGMRVDRPAEHWLVKAWDDDVLVDLIYEPSGLVIDDSVFERADELDVYALRLQVMPIEDVLVTKLHAMGEHQLDYESVLEIARTLREQIDWSDVRARTADSPYARAFFTLVEELGVVEPERVNAVTALRLTR
ncbi:MAG TPA: nucleotidyltransferase [Gaiellaceae bacterium]|nr:nucleotidyltransferase [Gaiellaceae bacterium]